MLASTEGIVLHTIKYGESSVIATIYTREFGRQSYLINAAHGKQSKNKAGMLQPLFLVDIVAYHKQSRELNRVKELKSNQTYQNISFDIAKSTTAIFLAEMLYRSIHEQESYPEMYDFIKHSLLYFDLLEVGAANFHIYFLYRLTEYLGFLPVLKKQGFQNWFDMKKGAVVHVQPLHPFYVNKDTTENLIRISSLKLHEIDQFKVARKMRDDLLSAIVDYYLIHFDDSREIKSLNVLREVFE
ncbi:MAG: DNA repair protein RecO [Prolixibacteraceae bacterium]|nr:DNA repair protein RecO [Prolixibacteraceae bacterium]